MAKGKTLPNVQCPRCSRRFVLLPFPERGATWGQRNAPLYCDPGWQGDFLRLQLIFHGGFLHHQMIVHEPVATSDWCFDRFRMRRRSGFEVEGVFCSVFLFRGWKLRPDCSRPRLRSIFIWKRNLFPPWILVQLRKKIPWFLVFWESLLVVYLLL